MLGFVDSMMLMASNALKQSVMDYCELETSSLRHNALVAKDGSMVTLLEIEGINKMLGSDEYSIALDRLRTIFSSAFSKPGHSYQFGFNYDPEGAEMEIEKSLGKSRTTARNLNLSLEDLLEERKAHLSGFTARERAVVAIWTHISVIPRAEMKRIRASKKRQDQEALPPVMPDAQSFRAEIDEIGDRHARVIDGFISEMKAVGVNVVELEKHDGARMIRSFVDPNQTSEGWRPILMGDKIPLRLGQKLRFKADMSSVGYPPLYEQLTPRDAIRLSNQVMMLGDRMVLPMYVDLMPQEVKTFNELLVKLINSSMPWQINIQLSGEGLNAISTKTSLSGFLSFASMKNKQINKAVEGLRRMMEENNETLCTIRICLSTWVEGTDTPANRDLLISRANTLVRSVQSWGQCELSEITGDPIAGFFSTIPGYTSQNIGNPSVAPVSDVGQMLPLMRPASPWREGAIAFRTPEGKLWPFQPGSSLQATWINLIFAPPGRGKSVLLNMINLALCLAPGNKELPYIHIIDIGPSSSGLISLLRESLPEQQRHLVAHHRIKMDSRFAINPFDTQLGMRKPLPLERSFLINFLIAILTPAGKTSTHEALSGMVSQVVDDAYRVLSDKEQPKRYMARINKQVDDAIAAVDLDIDEHTSWYEVGDGLFDKGMIHEATIAQRYAVPTLADLVSVSRMPQIVDAYGDLLMETRESIIDAFSRTIAEIMKNYPVLSEPTRFDLGEARVVSIDLDEVAKGTGAEAKKQTGIMYMLARNLAKHFYLNESDIDSFPDKYREYQRRRIMGIRSTKKHLAYDEFHRTRGSQAIIEQVVIDMREGRKWDVIVSLLSQSINDFNEDMVDFSTGRFVLGAGVKETRDQIVKTFGLNDRAASALRLRLTGPTAKGSNVLAIFDTNRGEYTQLLTSTIGPQELWAYSTTNEDAVIRNYLYSEIGAVEARRLLARRFPGGSAKSEIEKRMSAMAESETAADTDAQSESVIEALTQELLDDYRQQQKRH